MKRVIKIVGVVVVGLAVGLGVAALVLTGILPVPFGPMAEARAAADRARPPVTVMYPTKERVVNLADKETPRFLKTQVTLEFIDQSRKEPPKGEAVKAQQEEFAKDMTGYTAIIEDSLTMVLSSRTSAQLLDPAGKEALRREMIDRLNRALFPEHADEPSSDKPRERVVNAYFQTFIIQ